MKSRANKAQIVRLPVWRAFVSALFSFAGFIALAARVLYLQGTNNDNVQARGESSYARVQRFVSREFYVRLAPTARVLVVPPPPALSNI